MPHEILLESSHMIFISFWFIFYCYDHNYSLQYSQRNIRNSDNITRTIETPMKIEQHIHLLVQHLLKILEKLLQHMNAQNNKLTPFEDVMNSNGMYGDFLIILDEK